MTARIDRRGLPDGSGRVDCLYEPTAGENLFGTNAYGLIDGQWVPWDILVETLGYCACGGTGRVGPSHDEQSGEWSKKGALEPCPHCPNGAAQAAHYRRLGHRTWAGLSKCRREHPHTGTGS